MELVPVGPQEVEAFAGLWARAVAAQAGSAVSQQPSAQELDKHQREILGDPDARARLALVDGEAVGLYLVSRARRNRGAGEAIPGAAHLVRVAVEPSRWGEGIGSRLLQDAVQSAALAGYARLELAVRVDNWRARRLYERHGWVDANDRYVHKRTGSLIMRYDRPLQ